MMNINKLIDGIIAMSENGMPVLQAIAAVKEAMERRDGNVNA